MNSAIELHDSELTTVTCENASVVLQLSPAYVHRSEGRTGFDPGSGWIQNATLDFSDTLISASVKMPCSISDGWLQIGEVRYDNVIPSEGSFDAPCELWLITENAETLTVRGARLVISLHGEAQYVEEFREDC